jgi:hypothetical protein
VYDNLHFDLNFLADETLPDPTAERVAFSIHPEAQREEPQETSNQQGTARTPGLTRTQLIQRGKGPQTVKRTNRGEAYPDRPGD